MQLNKRDKEPITAVLLTSTDLATERHPDPAPLLPATTNQGNKIREEEELTKLELGLH